MNEVATLIVWFILVTAISFVIFEAIGRWTTEQTYRELYPQWKSDPLLGRDYPDKTFADFKKWMNQS